MARFRESTCPWIEARVEKSWINKSVKVGQKLAERWQLSCTSCTLQPTLQDNAQLVQCALDRGIKWRGEKNSLNSVINFFSLLLFLPSTSVSSPVVSAKHVARKRVACAVEIRNGYVTSASIQSNRFFNAMINGVRLNVRFE